MARQDTNFRVVPEDTVNLRLNPQAQPVDKEIKYQPQLGEANSIKPIADGLAKLGQGLVDIHPVIERKASENVLAAQAKLEEENKKDWAKVSKKVTGLGIFNPYNKRAFNQITAGQMQREAINGILSDPELMKKPPEEFALFTQNALNNLSEQYKTSNISQRDYIASLEIFNNQINHLKQTNAVEYAKYNFEQTKNKMVEMGSHSISVEMDNNEDKFIGMQNALNTSVKEMNDLGWADDTIANVLFRSVQDYVVTDPSKVNSAILQGAFNDFKINGKTMQEIIPDFNTKLRQAITQAKRADLQDRQLEYETTQFEQKLQRNDAMTEWYQKINNGEIQNGQQMKEFCTEAVTKYGLDGENSIQLFNDLISGRKTYAQLKSTVSDPEVKTALEIGLGDNSTTKEMIMDAMRNGTLSGDDGVNMMQQIDVEAQKQKKVNDKRIDEHIKETTKEYLKDDKSTGYKAKLRNNDTRQYLNNKMNELKTLYDEGKITPEQFNNELAKEKSAAVEYERRRRKGETIGAMAGYENIVGRTPQISDKQWQRVNPTKSLYALRRMGLIKTTDFGVESYPQKYRAATKGRHTGYDLNGRNIYLGAKVYPPQKGTVVGVLKGDNGGMGNVVVIRCANGKYIKYMHLQDADLPYTGTYVTPETVIGHVGNTGRAYKGGSLHVEFYDKNQQWITAYQFAQDIPFIKI